MVIQPPSLQSTQVRCTSQCCRVSYYTRRRGAPWAVDLKELNSPFVRFLPLQAVEHEKRRRECSTDEESNAMGTVSDLSIREEKLTCKSAKRTGLPGAEVLKAAQNQLRKGLFVRSSKNLLNLLRFVCKLGADSAKDRLFTNH